MATNLKHPELNLTGNISENFKNFEVRFNDYCVQANYRNLDLPNRFKFWGLSQTLTESVQAWEVRIRQAGSLCSYGTLSDEMTYHDKFIFGLNNDAMRAELLKTNLKPDNTPKSMADVVTEAKALESAYTANKLIADSSKSTIDEQVHWVKHKEMKVRREPGTCHWCGDKRRPHPWRQTLCTASGKTCSKCGNNDHFANVCLANGPPPQRRRGSYPPPTCSNWTPSQTPSNRGSG